MRPCSDHSTWEADRRSAARSDAADAEQAMTMIFEVDDPERAARLIADGQPGVTACRRSGRRSSSGADEESSRGSNKAARGSRNRYLWN